MRVLLPTILAVTVLAGGARAADTGMLVVRVVTDPSPAGVTWTYTGAGGAITLDDTTKEHGADVAAGTYHLVETSTAGAATLTSVQCVDPSRNSRGRVAAAAADVVLEAGETVVCTFAHRALGARQGAAATALAARFAPTFRFAAAERYHPITMEDYLSRATLRGGSPPRGATVQPQPTLFTLPTSAGASYLDVRGAQPYSNAAGYRTIEQQLEQAHPRPTIYWRVAQQRSTGRTAIEYWLLFLYNDFTDRHEADWEHVTVFLDAGAPLGVAYSQHQGDAWSGWPAAAADDHPVVYVARGSHANYPLAGSYRVKVCWTIRVRRCTTTKTRDDARGVGATLRASGYDLVPLGGAGYTGSWGSGSYVLALGLTKDRVVDPRRRSDYSNPFARIPAGA